MNKEHVRPLQAALQATEQMLRSELTSVRRISKVRFPLDDIRSIITLAYESYVNSRNVSYQADNRTKSAISSVAKWLTSADAKISLMIQGTIGSGKTTLAKATCRAIHILKEKMEAFENENGWRLDNTERNSLRCEIYSLPATRYIPALQVNDMAKEATQFCALCRTSGIMVIDDLGQEETSIKDYGTVRNPIIELINYRYDHRLPMVLTTNLDDAGIVTRYGERIMDRLREDCNTITCVGSSYRK